MQRSSYSPLDFSNQGQFINLGPQMTEFAGLGPAALSYNNQASMGMLPSMIDNRRFRTNVMQNEALKYDLRLQDRRPIAAATTIGSTFGGAQGGAFMGNLVRQSPVMQNLMSSALDMTGMSSMFGGNPSDLGYGALAMTTSGGMKLNGRNMSSRTQRLEAANIAKNLYDEYYTSSGMAKTDSINGISTDRMSEIMAVGASSGAFRGLESSKITQGADGKLSRSVNKKDMGQIKNFVEDASDMLREMEDVFGDRSFAELADISQKLTGMSIGGQGNAAAMTRRIRSIKNSAGALGMDAKEVMGDIMESAGVLQQYGLGSQTSRQIASSVSVEDYHTYAQAATERQRQGRGGRVMSFNEYTRMHAIDSAAMLNDEYGEKVSALSVLGNRELEGKDKDRLNELINSGDRSDIFRAAQFYQEKTGRNLNESISESGGIESLMSTATNEELDAGARARSAIVRQRNRERRKEMYMSDRDISSDQADAMVNTAGQLGDQKAAEFMRAVASGKEINASDYGVSSAVVSSLQSQLMDSFGGDGKSLIEAAKTHNWAEQAHAVGKNGTALATHGLGEYRDRERKRMLLTSQINDFGLNLDEEVERSQGSSFLAGLLGDSGRSTEQTARLMHMERELEKSEDKRSLGLVSMSSLETFADAHAVGPESVNKFMGTEGGRQIKNLLAGGFNMEMADGSTRTINTVNAMKASEFMTTDEEGRMKLRDDLTAKERARAEALTSQDNILNKDFSKLTADEKAQRAAMLSRSINELGEGDITLQSLGAYESQIAAGRTEVGGQSVFAVQQLTGEGGVNAIKDSVDRLSDSKKNKDALTALVFDDADITTSGKLDRKDKRKLAELITKEKMSGAQAMEAMGIDDEELLAHADEIEKSVKAAGEESWLGSVYQKQGKYLPGMQFLDKLGLGRGGEFAVGDVVDSLQLGTGSDLKKMQKLMRSDSLDITQAAQRMSDDKGLEGDASADYMSKMISEFEAQFYKTDNIEKVLKNEDAAKTFVNSSLGDDVYASLQKKVNNLDGDMSKDERKEARELIEAIDALRENINGGQGNVMSGGGLKDFVDDFNKLIDGDALNVIIKGNNT